MMLGLSVLPLSAVVPSFLLIWYFRGRDTFPEPARVLWASFGLGVLSIVPTLALDWAVLSLVAPPADPLVGAAFDAFVTAAFPEELLKFCVLYFYCARHREFDEPMDGIVYGSVSSLGFATLENVLYVSKEGLGVALMRAATAVPAHALWGAIMGYFVAQAKFGGKNKPRCYLAALSIPILAHGLYDFPLMLMPRIAPGAEAYSTDTALLLLLVPIVLIGSWLWVQNKIRRLRSDQLERLELLLVQGVEVRATMPKPRSRALSISSIVFGAIAATLGAFFTLALLAGLTSGAQEYDRASAVIAGGVVAGVAPLVLGLLLFRYGLRGLNERRGVVALRDRLKALRQANTERRPLPEIDGAK
jgi:RsiW-degrading membrane proteinase PrsW (M82 family)